MSSNDFSPIELKNIDYPHIHIQETIGDGSCFFHCILSAKNKAYSMLTYKHKIEKAKELREYLSEMLEIKKDGKMIYDRLARGQLREQSKAVADYKLENMQKTLCSSKWVGDTFNELISEVLNIDIYIIDGRKSDVYITANDFDILYKNRPSIVIHWNGSSHYSLIGVKEKAGIVDLFQYDHEFIVELRNRMKEVIRESVKKAEERKKNVEKKENN
jgi:hypothetical protein